MKGTENDSKLIRLILSLSVSLIIVGGALTIFFFYMNKNPFLNIGIGKGMMFSTSLLLTGLALAVLYAGLKVAQIINK